MCLKISQKFITANMHLFKKKLLFIKVLVILFI